MAHLQLEKGPILEHVPAVIGRLEAGIIRRPVDRHGCAVVQPAIEANGFGFIHKNRPS